MRLSLPSPGAAKRRVSTIITGDEVAAIQAVVRGYFSLRHGELVGPRRARRVSWPRQIAMALVRQKVGRSLPEIGKSFGNRDHTTVMHALRAVQDRRKADPACEAEFREIERRVGVALCTSYVRRQDIWGKPFVSVRGKGGAT